MSEKELVWLPKSLADQVEKLTQEEEIEKAILTFIDQAKANFQNDLESISEDALQYKARLSKAKQAFRETTQEYLDADYQVWEKFDEDLHTTREFVDKAVKTLEPLKDTVQQIRDLMVAISSWDFQNLMETMERIAHADKETRDMVKFLMENFNKETK